MATLPPESARPAPPPVLPYRPPYRSRGGSPYATAHDLWAPLAVLALGAIPLFLRLAQMDVIAVPAAPGPLGKTILVLGWNAAVMFATLFLVARWTGGAFGPPHVALLKLTAVVAGSFGLGAVPALIVDGSGTGFIGWVLCAATYWGLLGWFFDLDPQETFICAGLTTVIRWASYLAFFLAAGGYIDFCC